MSNQVASTIIAELSRNLLDQIDKLEIQNAQNLQFLKTVVTGWKNGTLTADQIQVMNNGDMRIKGTEPSDSPVAGEVATCNEIVAEALAKLGTNGKEAAKDMNPLAEPVAVGQPEGRDGS
jgi:hypothetical protein